MKKDVPDRYCRNCAHMTDPHTIGANGQPIVGRCPFKKWCVLLNYSPDSCDKYKPRTKI